MNRRKGASFRYEEIELRVSRLRASLTNEIYNALTLEKRTVAWFARRLGWRKKDLQSFLDGDGGPPTLYTLGAIEIALNNILDIKIRR